MGPPMPELAYDFDRRGDIVPANHARRQRRYARPVASGAAWRRAEFRCAPVTRAPMPAPLAPQPKPSDLTLDRSRDALLTDFGKTTLNDRYLLPGESYQDMFARVAYAYADDIAHAQRIYDYMSQALVHAGDAGAVEWRRRARPADLVLPECGARLARRHHGHLERERLARLQWRRHRHLLGRRSFHRRKGRPERPDQRHHPVHPRDGLADAGDLARLAAARLGRGAISTSTTPRSRSSSKSASPPATSTARA